MNPTIIKKIITNNFNAEYGRNVGSQVLYLTKGGTNRIHGEAYEYFRNNVLDARAFFDTSGKAALIRRNQYGFDGIISHAFMPANFARPPLANSTTPKLSSRPGYTRRQIACRSLA